MTANQIARLVVKIESSGVGKVAADLTTADRAGRQASASVDSLNRSLKSAGSSASGASGGVGALTKHVEQATKATDLWTDSQGRWRNSTGQFASAAEKAAAGVEGLGDSFDKFGKSKRKADVLINRNIGTFGTFGSAIMHVQAAVGALGGGFGPLMGTLVLLAPVMLAIVGAAIALGAALAPLVGLGAAAAVGLTAFAQAASVVALASMGVGDALKEQMQAAGKAGKAASTGADQQRAAARAITNAQDGVRRAQEGVRSATESLTRAEQARAQALKALGPAQTQARRDLTDLHSALSSASISERQAIQGLAEARKALVAAANPADAGRLADAQTNLTSTTLNEERAVRGLAAARQALDDLMKPADALTVADAQDAVADATRGETRAALALAKAQQAVTAAANDPTMSDADKAQAKLDLADAENAIGDASRSSAHAQEQLAKLQAGPDPREVARAKQDIADAEQSVADASANTAKATRDVQDAQKGADPEAVAKAQLDIAAAEQVLTDATRDRLRLQKDVLAADKLGVDGSAGVVTARENIRDAGDQVTDAERRLIQASRDAKRATQDLRDAQIDAKSAAAGLAAANVDLNEKFNNLPPAAQSFVRVLQRLKPKLDDLRSTAAAGLFPGVTDGLNAAMGSFDSVKTVTGETATAIGDLAKRAGKLVGSKGFGKDLETIGGRNATIISRVGGAAIYAGDALRHILIAAGPLTTWLAKATEEWFKNLDASAKAGRESGKLADFFQKVRNTLKRVVSIVGNLGTAFYEVGKQAAPFGRDMLESIDKVSGKFAAWTKSVDGQKALQNFFRTSADLASKLGPALGGVLGSLGDLAFRVMPVYVAILEKLGPLAGPIVAAFVAYRIALTGVTIATNIAAAATKIWAAGQWLLNFALSANPIGLVVIAVATLVAGVIIAYKKSETFRGIIDALWDAIKSAAGAVWDFITSLGDLPGKLLDAGKALTAGLLDGIKALPGLLADAATWLWDKLKAGLESYATAYGAIGKWVLGKFVEGFKAITDGIVGAGGWVKNRLGEGIEGAAGAVKSFGGDMLGWIVTGFKAVTDPIVGVGGWIKNRIGEGLDLFMGAFKGLGGNPINWIVEGFKSYIELTEGVGGWIKNRLDAGLETAKEGIKGLGGTVIGWIIEGLKKGAFELQGFLNKIIDVINEIPGVKIGHINVLKKDDKGNVTGFARGGAFARTGGYVDSPITLMGEEAPRHPEFVIPTNPAYRKRAQGLLGQAAGAIGLARGGVHQAFAEGGINQYNHVFPAHHLDEPGFRMAPDDVMAIAQKFGLPGRAFEQIAHGESDYHPGVVQRDPGDGMVGYGMWQMTPNAWGDAGRAKLAQLGGLGQMLNPFKNAEMAKVLYDGGGLGQWYGTKYLGQKGSEDAGGGGFFDSIKSALGGAWDLLKDGAGALLGTLPSTDGLGWLAGVGKYALSKVGEWIKDKASSILGGGGGGGGGGGASEPSGVSGVGMFDGRQVAKWIIPELKYARAHGWDGPITSGWRSQAQQDAIRAADPRAATVSEHLGTQYPRGAVDFGGFVDAAGLANKQAFMAAVAGYKGQKLIPTQGFRDDGHMSGTGHYMGGVYGGLLGSYEQGTPYVPQTGPYLLHRGEAVTPAQSNRADGPARSDGPLVHIEHAEFKSEADLTALSRKIGWELLTR